MQIFQHNEHAIRLIDQRPKAQAIQVNVFNPNDPGHSYCAFVQTMQTTEESPGTPEDLSVVFDALVAGGVLDLMINKAKQAFATPSPA